MTRLLFNGAFALGVAVLAWVAAGFAGSHLLAFVVTLVIGAVYGLGAFELHQFRKGTDTLCLALEKIPEPLPALEPWLDGLHPSLRNPVRLRIEGERTGLPGPALTPYLVGLLVMLGMLGTFLGMVVTLDGAVFALEGTTDLQTMRAAVATPIKGLGLAFGTSVAGVASSALLGLMSALARRERLHAAQALDTAIATRLRSFSASFQRQETLKALQAQTQALPAVVDQLQSLMNHMQRMGQQLNDRLISNQEGFHSHVQSLYTGLADSVDKSLTESLRQSARIAGESLTPVVQMAMAGVAQEASVAHTRMMAGAQAQLDTLTTQLRNEAQAAHAQHTAAEHERLRAWTASLAEVSQQLHTQWQASAADTHAHTRTTLAELGQLTASTEGLVRARMEAESHWTDLHTQRMDSIAASLQASLGSLRDQEAQRGDAAVARLGELQTALTQHLATLGTALEAPITRLIHTAAEAPRAAAEVISQLRTEMSNGVARDNDLLEERSRILHTLNGLLDTIGLASVEQRGVIDTLVASSAVALQQATGNFADKLGTEAGKLSDVAAHVSSSAVEVASLSETLGFAMRSFTQGNDKLIGSLQRIEAAMDKSMLRQDEQLGYYVAQAREIIDLCIGSQKQVLDELRGLPRQPSPATEEAL